jgi:GDP-L-fucose synthase
MPTNLYGPRDNFDLESAHVLPALIHRIHNAKINGDDAVEIWGDGTPLREFLHVEDLARACLNLLHNYNEIEAINIGSGQEVSIRKLATLISEVIGFSGLVSFNKDRPNGTPRKLLDSSRISNLGWSAQVSLENGISSTYNWFLENHEKGPSR